MTIDLTGLVRPHLLEMSKREDNPNAAEFRLQPLERGFGYTLGNSLRRLLLSSLRGSAVWGFRLDGVVHEHQTVQGVLEDVHQIIQRLKGLTLVLSEDVDEAVLHIKKSGPGAVYARDIQEHGAVRVVNPDHLLFTVQDDREVSAELYVGKGRGYVESEFHAVDRSMPVDLVRIDAIYNPVIRANFTVAETRVGQRTTTTG
jgi:DNA-directed RNA polymerase subunit alpha